MNAINIIIGFIVVGKQQQDERQLKNELIAPVNASKRASKTKQWQLWRHHGCDELRPEEPTAS